MTVFASAELYLFEDVIYNRRIYEGSDWNTYSGTNPHVDHVHVSLLPKAARELTAADIEPIFSAAGMVIRT